MANLALMQVHSGYPPKAPFAEMIRRALERSQLYLEELGIDLAKPSDAELRQVRI